MKIKKVMLKNFAKVSEIQVNFSDSVTYLCGGNGAGKTTVGLNAIWFVLKGLAQKGDGLIAERFRFVGDFGRSATGVIEIQDEKEGVTHTVSRKLLKHKTELEIKSSDGIKRDQEWLDDLFSAILINPFQFSQLSGKEQALMLGIDTTEFDAKRKALEEERTLLGREARRLEGTAEESWGTEKVEEVSVTDLLTELDRRRKHNQENAEATRLLEKTAKQTDLIQDKILGIKEHIQHLEAQLSLAKQDLNEHRETLKKQETLVSELKDEDESEIQAQIKGAEEINIKARAYKKALADQEAAEAKRAEYKAKQEEIAQVDDDLANYLKAQELPFSNITIEDGEFRLNGKPFRQPYFSTGECLKFGAKLAAKIAKGQGQKLDYVWIPDSQDLDEENRESLFESLVKQGLQVVAEFVDTKKREKGTSILLYEQKVVEEETGKSLE